MNGENSNAVIGKVMAVSLSSTHSFSKENRQALN